MTPSLFKEYLFSIFIQDGFDRTIFEWQGFYDFNILCDAARHIRPIGAKY